MTQEFDIDNGEAILNLPMPADNDAEVETVREFLQELLSVLWYMEEGFSGKRPLGNSGWKRQVYTALSMAGIPESDYDLAVYNAIYSL